ncbi:MAG: PQQ-binding-like beta-propeller repeat protein [Verrucomicrobiota bacterium]
MTRLLLSFLLGFAIGSISAAEWPRFRGPNGSGLNRGAVLPSDLNEAELVFEIEVAGIGHGSPVIWGDHLYLLTAIAEEQSEAPETGKSKKAKGKGKSQPVSYGWATQCFDRESGELIWEKRFPPDRFKGHRFNSPASSTAAVDEERIVFAWGTAEALTLVSLDHDGALQWHKTFDGVVGGHGFGGSPILYEGLVILNNDQEKQNGNLFALDAASGEIAWTVERRSERISYSVPCVYDPGDGAVLVFTNWQHGFTAIDPEDGSVVDDLSVFNTDTNERAISSPIVAGDLVIGTCGFTANPKHCVAMRLVDRKWTEVWRIERNVPHIPGVLAVGERVFLVDDSGILTIVERATGKELDRARIPDVEGVIYGSPVSDGRHLYFADESGNLHVLAVADELSPVSRYSLGETIRTTPAIVEGTLYIRSETKLSAFRAAE